MLVNQEDVASDAVPLPQHPDHENGEQWSLIMFHGTSRACADSAGELLSLMIPDYPDASVTDDVGGFALRLDHAVEVANIAQGAYFQEYLNERPDTELLGNDQALTAIHTSKDATIDPDWLPQDSWGRELPVLVVLDVMYAPFTSAVMPEGENVLVVNVYREMDYLKSLASMGFITLFAR